ncbi:hypothetical protein [Agreia sp. COWG]|uniref:hypothetical protein n=1 Tax=Agreia sp. COWG TaxID=2773266 RepID=UPI0019271D2F|nr:hypothetical protein [Agreia sp. COWG]CAD6009534.1 conserved protein of unknown function [Agreia sp. COWG]
MSNEEQNKPVMEGSDDASNSEKLSGLKAQVEHDHGHQGADSVSSHLKDRMAETGVEEEEEVEAKEIDDARR